MYVVVEAVLNFLCATDMEGGRGEAFIEKKVWQQVGFSELANLA